MLKDMFKKTYTIIDTKYKGPKKDDQVKEEPNIPHGLWKKCNKCANPIYAPDVTNNFYVCPKCGGYFRMHAYRRIEMLLDAGTFEEWNKEMDFSNPLNFPGYEKKVEAARAKTRMNEAIVTGCGSIMGQKTAIGVCDARFLMSSMGHVVGEKITQMVERATAEQLPVIIVACSGGARMQEGIVSLMQMAKTSAALKRHHEAGQLFISVLSDPTTGGVTASFAMLGDIIIAEPGALIGFAGPRVIQQTIGQKLPEGFQRAEFLLDHGFVDKIVPRSEQKETLATILKLHQKPSQNPNQNPNQKPSQNPNQKPNQTRVTGWGNDGDSQRNIVDNQPHIPEKGGKSAWGTVLLSRNAGRPTACDYIRELFDDFMEFHGDRYFGDDGAIVGGIAAFNGVPVTVIGQQKGKNTKENIKRNFGMPSPEGYRKALRLMKQAETFDRPIICFVDTPGAFCGLEAEERGQGEAIARNLFEMSDLTVPVVSIVIGEGGSGGALAMAAANEVWMMENAIYSILSPEGFASILWKDSKKAPDAAKVMKITAADLYEMKLIEAVIPEPEPACAANVLALAAAMRQNLQRFLTQYEDKEKGAIREQRYERFRRM